MIEKNTNTSIVVKNYSIFFIISIEQRDGRMSQNAVQRRQAERANMSAKAGALIGFLTEWFKERASWTS
jgi:hypothetical protein